MNSRRMISRREFLKYAALASSLAFGMSFAGCAGQPQKKKEVKVLKISHQWPAPAEGKGDFRAIYLQKFAERVQEETNGSLKFEIYPAQSLFKAKEQFEAMSKGALDMSFYPLIYAAGKIPEFGITLLPCIVKDYDQAKRWRNSKVGDLIRSLSEEKGVKIMDMVWETGNFASKSRPIIIPEDVKGLKMRVPGKWFEKVVTAKGASVTSMSSAEVYEALRTGVIDATATSDGSFVSFHIYEVTKYFTADTKYSTVWALESPCISLKTWNALTTDEQQAILKVVKELRNYLDESSEKMREKAAETFESHGVEVHDMSLAEWKEWRDLAEDTGWKIYIDGVARGREIIDMALKV